MRTKEKYTSGDATRYISKRKAMRHLQLSWSNFRRLCILKGIYPQEPHRRQKLGRGSSQYKTYYMTKDIKFLAHEPLLQRFRELRRYIVRWKHAMARKDSETMMILKKNKPHYSLHHLVKERYPTMEDALNDLTDNLNLIFLFARLPRINKFSPGLIRYCRRLSVEFLNYCIATQAVRKTFISIRGLYLQAALATNDSGATVPVTWCLPHQAGAYAPSDVDYRIMGTFVEFAVTHIACVLRHLYQTAGLVYPPQLLANVEEDADIQEQTHQLGIDESCSVRESRFQFLAALAFPIARKGKLEDDSGAAGIDAEAMELLKDMDADFVNLMNRQAEEDQIKHLFQGKKFFLNREVPKEYLCLLIRSCGGEVSWPLACGLGASFKENDPTIDYHVMDRPMLVEALPKASMEDKRKYVAPQWIADSVNANRLLPTEDYTPGEDLPPHLSPFVSEGYQPPEMDYLKGKASLQDIRKADGLEEEGDSAMEEEIDESSDESEGDEFVDHTSEEDLDSDMSEDDSRVRKNAKLIAKVEPGQPAPKSKIAFQQEASKNAMRKLRELQLPKRQQRVYQAIRKDSRKKERQPGDMVLRRKTAVANMKKQKK